MSRRWLLSGDRIAVFVMAIAIALANGALAIAQSRFVDSGARDRDFGFSQWQDTSEWAGGMTSAQVPEWKLGVQADNTETGVVIRSVTPGSAASRMRFEPGDIIITVNGFQVGIVNDGLYDLREELTRRADKEGFVSLIVQDHINRSLHKVQVRLDGSQSALRGELIYRERFTLSPDAIVAINLENVSRPFAVVRNGQVLYRLNSSAPTIPFEINYDPAYITPQDIYQVRATISSGGRTILETRQPARVLTQGNPNQVKLLLSAPATTVGNTGNALAGAPPQVITAGYPNLNTLLQQQVAQVYRQYLEREPFPLEWVTWTMTPGASDRIASLPLELMASQEYFDKVGNSNPLWFASIFQSILGKRPSQREVAEWMRRFAEVGNSRTELLRQLYTQASAKR